MVKKIFRIFKKTVLWFLALSVFLVIVFRFVPVFYTPLMTIRAVENLFDGKDMVCSHDWEPIENLSVNLQKAAIAGEDATFLKHHGFDFDAIEKAMKSNEKGKKLRGGSTISQQTAKNVFLWQGRSWLRKGLETWFTILIEVFWSKERIMEVYLNSIEMGDGVYGAEAASKYWYRKSAKNLTKREAAGIVAILPNPRKFKATNSSAYINRKKGRIQAGMASVKLDY
ncbi:monofunctional biosynthetic peptidoglycan transglycosylase [Flavobacterium sp.]|uniref:monofunctional biosynthetic peptidoglycan transglycosylase n=1 Tax=Flavobacterium sp. TaxID=239 RepID=UPI0039E33475